MAKSKSIRLQDSVAYTLSNAVTFVFKKRYLFLYLVSRKMHNLRKEGRERKRKMESKRKGDGKHRQNRKERKNER